MSLKKLSRRIRDPEEIDDPALAADQLDGALRGLATINRFSASAGILWRPIRDLARDLKTDRLRVLDLATGGGDIPLALWRKAARAGLRLEIHGVDISERAIQFAGARAERRGARIQFSRRDVLADGIPDGYDVVTSSLFLHHLDDESAGRMLHAMSRAAERLVLINDLRRDRWGLLLAHFAGRALTRSQVVRVDSVRSVRAAFTMPEIRALAAEAGLAGAVVSRRWPCRFLLSWRR